MKINQSPNFQGINISKANVLGRNLDIYKLTEKDKEFTSALKNIDLKNLLPPMNAQDFLIYNTVFQTGLSNAHYKNKTGMLLSCDDVPCGILVSFPFKNKLIGDFICTWPLRKGEKAPFGAQTLITQMFKNFLDTNASLIEIYAIRYGSIVSKYLKIGFCCAGGDDYSETMNITRERAKTSLEKLNQRNNLIPTNSTEDVNLFDTLKH